MRFLCLSGLLLFSGVVFAGQLNGANYIGDRFGRIELVAPTTEWLILDRESSGNNEFGGPVVDLKATVSIAGYFPSLHLSAFKRIDVSVTPAFVLQTSRDAVEQRGGELGPIQNRVVDGKNTWFFEAKVWQKDQPARLYYVLLEGSEAIYALQTVVPEAALIETKRRVDELLLKVKY